MPSNPTAHPPVIRPETITNVYSLLKELGHNLEHWAWSESKQKTINPVTNTYRNSQWSFDDVDGRIPSVVCLWFRDIGYEEDTAFYDGNDRQWRFDLHDKFTYEERQKNKQRIAGWRKRSEKLDQTVRLAHDKRLPLHVIVVGGERDDDVRDESELPDIEQAARVESRGIDPATWWVHSYDDKTGAYRIYRDKPLPPKPAEPDPAYLDPANDPAFIRFLESLDDTEREAMVKARVCQGIFRQGVIKRWNGKCSVTGLEAAEFLVASHIVPWAKCETALQRISSANGLLLTPNIDKLFDKGLISFDSEGKMLFSEALPGPVKAYYRLDDSMCIGKVKILKDSTKYLEWHRSFYGPWRERK